jgi:hypothetical protein
MSSDDKGRAVDACVEVGIGRARIDVVWYRSSFKTHLPASRSGISHLFLKRILKAQKAQWLRCPAGRDSHLIL